jgi:hypothetical protein
MDQDPVIEHADRGGRPPEGLREKLLANSRPQPAIPAIVVLMLAIAIPVMSLPPGEIPDHENASLTWLLVPLAILASCGLAVAAGFCSVFPQLAWILLATWALKFTQAGGPLPGYNRYVLLTGMLACGLMFGYQLYRVQTGQFVPTITDREPDDEPDG